MLLWKKDLNFSQTNIFELNLTDYIPSDTTSTEMALEYVPNSSMYALYSSSFTFYLGAGMHN